MKHLYISIFFLLFSFNVRAQDSFQLAPPLLRYPSVFFTKEAVVEMVFAEAGTQIRYTLNGQEPNDKSPIYKTPLHISQHFTTLKARVFGEKFKPSEAVQATFIKDGIALSSIDGTKANPRYKGLGKRALWDNKGGNTSISSNTWLGFETDTVDLILSLKQKAKVKKVLINFLRDYGSWVFLPEKIEIYSFDNRKKTFQHIANQSVEQKTNISGAVCIPLVLPCNEAPQTNKIKLRLHLVKQLPDWHPGKGNKGWIFMDEIKVYDK